LLADYPDEVDTFVRLPRDQWPAEWPWYKDPYVRREEIYMDIPVQG